MRRFGRIDIRGALLATVLLVALGGVAEPVMAGDEAEQALVKLKVTTWDGGRRIGSGFVVYRSSTFALVVTAAHVIEGSQDIEARYAAYDFDPRPATTVHQDALLDIAVVRVSGTPPEPVKALSLGERFQPRISELLEFIGFPGDVPTPLRGQGPLAGFEGSRWRIAAVADEGNSGGPVVHDGRVVGILVEAGRQHAVAVPLGILRSTLEAWELPLQRASPSRPRRGLGSREGDRQQRHGKHPRATLGKQATRLPCGGFIHSSTGGTHVLRSIPSRGAASLGKVQAGTAVKLVARAAGEGEAWFQVQVREESKTGWVQSRFVIPASDCQ